MADAGIRAAKPPARARLLVHSARFAPQTFRCAAAHDAQDHQHPIPMKTITVAALDGGKPVLGLAKAAHRNGIQAEHDGQEDRAPQHPITPGNQ